MIRRTILQKGLLKEYFADDEKVKYESSPFLLDSKFEYELYTVLPMTLEELEEAEKKHKGKQNKCTEALQHILVWSREDISYTVIRLSGYNAAPSLPCWRVLDHLMRYLFHKSHVPIMLSRNKTKEPEISAHHAK